MKMEKSTRRGITGPVKLTEMSQIFCKYFKKDRKHKILDAGGTYHTYCYLKTHFTNSQINLLNNNKNAFINIDNAILGDAESLEKYVEKESFDIVFSTELIEHLVDPYSFFDRVKFSLKK